MSSNLKIYTDGGSRGNPGLSACAFVVIDSGKIIHKDAKYLGIKTNNEAEYFGVLIALEWLENNRNILSDKSEILFFLDSELVVRQILDKYRVKASNLKELKSKVKMLLEDIQIKVNFFSIPREKNKIADLLLNRKIDEKIG